MFVVSVLWVFSVFLNIIILYPGTLEKSSCDKGNGSHQQICAKRRRYLELNITVWSFIALITFVVVFMITLLPLSVEFNHVRSYVVGVSTSFQLGFLGSISIYLLFVHHLQPSTAASVAIWLVGVILSLAIIIYDVIVLQFTDDALDLASRIFVYSTLTSWFLFVVVNWIALFLMYKKYKTVLNGRRQKCERYMTPRMYVQFLNLKEKIRQLISANIFLSLSWIPYVLHVVIIGLTLANSKSDKKASFEFDWREKITLGTTLTVANTLIVPLLVLVNEETRKNLFWSFFPENKNTLSNDATKANVDKAIYNYSCREISNVGLINIPEMCLTDQLRGYCNRNYKQPYESDA